MEASASAQALGLSGKALAPPRLPLLLVLVVPAASVLVGRVGRAIKVSPVLSVPSHRLAHQILVPRKILDLAKISDFLPGRPSARQWALLISSRQV